MYQDFVPVLHGQHLNQLLGVDSPGRIAQQLAKEQSSPSYAAVIHSSGRPLVLADAALKAILSQAAGNWQQAAGSNYSNGRN